MPTPLRPPDYPDRPDHPLFAFGPSFGEEISRSVIAAVAFEDFDHPENVQVRVSASLTMLEAFLPADHLQCMLAAQGVAFQAATMDCLAKATHPGTPPQFQLRFYNCAARMRAAFSGVMRDLRLLQGGTTPRAPKARPAPDAPPPDDAPEPEAAAEQPPAPGPRPDPPHAPDLAKLGDPSDELPGDIATRPDGTPGTLAAYLPKPRPPVIPKEAAINIALATRDKPYRQVNLPKEQETPAQTLLVEPPAHARGVLDLDDEVAGRDALSRFASARLDPEAPETPLDLEEDEAIIELEILSTGGDPGLEARKAELMARHPEGRPISVIRLSPRAPERIEEAEPPDTS